MQNKINFDRLITIIVDSDTNIAEKHLNSFPINDLLQYKNIFGQSLLFNAIAADKDKIAQILIRKGFDINETDKNGRSLLHWAVKFSAFNSIRFILNFGDVKNKIFAKDFTGVTPLHVAAEHKRAKILKTLLSSLSDIHESEFDQIRDQYCRSPLHYAAQHGSLESCQVLLMDDYFAVDQKDDHGQTPLMFASSCKFAYEVVRLLGRKKPVSITSRNKMGWTALHFAVLANNLEALNIFLEELEINPSTVMDNSNRTPLHYAAAMGRVDAAKLLIKYGARNDTCDEFGASPAHYAAKCCVKTLETIVSDTNSEDCEDAQQRTCFMWAVLAENEEIVVWMLSNQSLEIDRHKKDKYGRTALHLAAHVGSLPIAKLLVKQGWSLSERDHHDTTPSHLAAGGGHTELIRHFQTALANTDERDGANRTPLFYACAGGQASTVAIMINDLNFAVNVVDRNGQTPLHYAVKNCHIACVKELLKKPEINVNAIDENGKTPLYLAMKREKPDIIFVLENAGAVYEPMLGQKLNV